MPLMIGEMRKAKNMTALNEVGITKGQKFEEFEEETHSHNTYKKDKFHITGREMRLYK